MSKRKYNPEYIKYGFISIKHQGEDLPQCVVCMKTLSNGAMKPSLLKRHLESNHPEKNDRNQSYFERLGENVKKRRLDQTGQNYQKMTGIVKASYEVSLLVAQNVKAHTIAETLILPAAKVLVRHLIGEKDVAKLESVSLSNDTVKRRINEMATDIADQVTAGIRASKYGFAIQVDESTDITSCCQLLVYARYTQDNKVKTELLMSEELSATTKGRDVFNILERYFTENELDWGNLVGCTTDGAPSMLGRKSGFQAYVKAVAPKATLVHCYIHRFALCARVLPTELLECLNRNIKLVNFVKASALNTIICKALRRSRFKSQMSSLPHGGALAFKRKYDKTSL
ncbi:zinc finger BED domain-containing protein 5-like [Ciona intestinalis]